jgi:PAS domain S-box-containing protein
METEKFLDDKDLIVSSTDKKGIINYVNKTFCDISGYSKDELYGQPHNIIRHPDMPKTIFRYAWDKLLSHQPVVAYVKNYVKDKTSYYWVKAVMYPKIIQNEITSITSYRTKATEFEIEQIKEIYKTLLHYETSHSVDQSYFYFIDYLKEKSLSYDKMINRLNDNQQILNVALLNLDLNKYKTDHMIFRSRIESLVEKGYKNIEVVKPTCCEFGKRLATLEGESFSKDPKFSEIQRIHEKVHNELQLFADTEDKLQRDIYMNEVYKDIDTLFGVMEELKNDHKHDK